MGKTDGSRCPSSRYPPQEPPGSISADTTLESTLEVFAQSEHGLRSLNQGPAFEGHILAPLRSCPSQE